LFYGVLGLMAMAAGALAFTLAMLPADFVRDRAIAVVKERTGRDLVISGPASFKLFPSVGVSLGDVSLSGAPGVEGAPPLVTMRALEVSVALLPLLAREVQVRTLVLREPVFNLAIDRKGARSWELAAREALSSGLVRLAQAESPASDAPGGLPGDATPAPDKPFVRLDQLKLDDVRIDNGTVNYTDARSGTSEQVKALNVKVALASMREPLSAEGDMSWKDKTVTFDGTLTSPAEVLDKRPAKLKFKIASDALEASFEGNAILNGAVAAEGILAAKSASVRSLASWLGSDLPPSDGFGALSAKGLVRSSPDQITYQTAEIVLDKTTARGDLTLVTKGARPYVKASLKLTELDLNTYSSHSGGARKKAAAQAPAPQESAPRQAVPAEKPQSIEDLLDQSGETAPAGPRVQGYTKRAGWSDEPYRLGGLGALDADAKLSIGKLRVATLSLGQSELTVALKNRVMKSVISDVQAYEGHGQGTVTIDGTAQSSANVSANVTLDGVSALPLLKDVAGIDRLSGKGRLVLALAGRGGNEREVVETLAGKIEFAFQDGAVSGVNIPQMVRNLRKGNLGGLETAPSDKTDFSELTSTWTVTAGVAENQDLKLVSPLLRLGGSGNVSLPAREVDYVLRPKVVASLAGQGGQQDLTGLEIPVRAHGPWDDLKFTPDLAGAFKDPNKAVDTIKEIGKQFKGKKADEIVNDLLGGGNSTTGAADPNAETPKSKGKKLLEQFLNGQ
jgi:AsmA protein